jgi:formate hydrogenlyase transcriptional activator
MDALVSYSWPGNIRELQNLIERSVIRSVGDLLEVTMPAAPAESSASPTSPARGTLEEAERAHILATLTETHWVIAGPRGAAARLGLHRSTLQFRMKKLGIDRPSGPADASA